MIALDGVKHYLSIAQAVATILAVATGGIWASIMYYQSREGHSRANVEHQLMDFNFSEDLVLPRIALVINNGSKRKLDLNYCDWKIERILPPDAYTRKQMRLMSEVITDDDPVNDITEGLYWSTILRHEENWEDGSFIVEPNQESVLVRFYVIPIIYKVINITTFCTDGKRRSANGSKIGSYITTTYTLGERKDESKAHKGCNHSGSYSERS